MTFIRNLAFALILLQLLASRRNYFFFRVFYYCLNQGDMWYRFQLYRYGYNNKGGSLPYISKCVSTKFFFFFAKIKRADEHLWFLNLFLTENLLKSRNLRLTRKDEMLI
jgi:hypothetical protein